MAFVDKFYKPEGGYVYDQINTVTKPLAASSER